MSGRGLDAVLRAAAAHVLVTSVDHPELDDADAHHLARVLRLRADEVVTVTDGAGRWRACRFAPPGGLRVDGEPQVVPPCVPPVHVAFAVPKGDRPELIVQKLVEIGADRITPMVTARTVVRWDAARAARHAGRFQRIGREALMQSRRVWAARIDALTSFATVAGAPGAQLAEPGGTGGPHAGGPVLVGPEGGWAPEELAVPLPRVTLGDHVLRAETAALVACALAVSARAAGVTGAAP